jgi:uncharacterized membrane protein
MTRVERSVTILRPRADVYAFWRELENLPRFMMHLEHVESSSTTRSHWVARAPAGQSVEWDADIVRDRPGEEIAWQSVEGSDIRNSGRVLFFQAPADRGTEIHVVLEYDAPAGAAGKTIAKLLGEEPSQQIRDDLRRLKQVLETGEVVRSDGSMLGAGQGAMKQRPSQPEAPEARP